MYTAYIGKRLVQALNERDGTKYTPRTFFDEVYFPLFFKNERYLFNANNSPVDQAYKNKGKKPLTAEVLDEQRLLIHSKINGGQKDASIYMGGASTDLIASTSGQVTALVHEVTPDDVYASWIGAGLGITIEGGLSLLIDDRDVLFALFDGWKEYREYLDQTPKLKANQVNTWNGQWIVHRLDESYMPGGFWNPNSDKEGNALTTVSWVQVVFALCSHFQDSPDRTTNAYIYSFGQMNRTAGFVRFNLPEIRRLSDLYNQLFKVPEGMISNEFVSLYQTEFSFVRAFQFGEIGLRALQPKDLRGFLDGSKQPKYNPSDASKAFQFQIHQLWIIAMLNNKDLLAKAEQLAKILREHANQPQQRGKMVNTRQAEEVLESKTRRDFIEQLTDIVSAVGAENATALDQIVTEIITLPSENVPLFLTLLRFKHAYLAAKPSAA